MARRLTLAQRRTWCALAAGSLLMAGCGIDESAAEDAVNVADLPVDEVVAAEAADQPVVDPVNLHCNAWLDITVAQPAGTFQSHRVVSHAFTTYADVIDDAALSFPSDDAIVLNQVAEGLRTFAESNKSTDSAAPLAELLEPMAGVAASATALCGESFVDDALNG